MLKLMRMNLLGIDVISSTVISAIIGFMISAWRMTNRWCISARQRVSRISPIMRLVNAAWARRFSSGAPAISRKHKSWNNTLPMKWEVLEQIRSLAKTGSICSAYLVSTDPPTIKMTPDGPMPVVDRLILMQNGFGNQSVPPNVVATYHTHPEGLDILDHDERLFTVIDALIGPKVHIIASPAGLRYYCASDGPEITPRDELPRR